MKQRNIYSVYKSVYFIKEIDKCFKIYAITWLQTCNLYHSYNNLVVNKLTRKLVVSHGLTKKFKHEFEVLAIYVTLSERSQKCYNLLFNVKHRKSVNQIIFSALWICTRFSYNLNKLLKFKCLFSVWKSRHLFRCINYLLWILRLVLRLSCATSSTIICFHT